MPAPISSADIAEVTAFLKARRLKHLRCRSRAGALILESGPEKGALSHVRLKKLSATTWTVDESHHTGRWEALPIRASLADALAAVVADFSWVLDA